MALDSIPQMVSLFPLPSTVLFPNTYLPLHIFEPRYREMVRETLEASRLIGMVLLKENWEKDYYGNPPVHLTGCVGRIVQVQRLDDGRYNIVLYGLEKFTVKGEVYSKSYRQAWIEPVRRVAGTATATALPESHRAELVSCVKVYAQLRGWKNQIQTVLDMPIDDERLVQVLSSELDLTPIEKQFLLEAEDLVRQCRRLIEFIGFMTAEYRSRKETNRPMDAGN